MNATHLDTLAALLPQGMSLAHYAGMAAMVLVGACLQGIGGVGFAMFSAPIAALFFPELAPGPLLALGGALALLSALREWSAVDWGAAGAALAGRALGSFGAAACLVLLPARVLAVLFALSILTGVALSLSGRRIEATRPALIGAGVMSGLMGTITSAGAPPFALVMQHLPPPRLRATLGCVFCAGAALSLLMLSGVGRFGRGELWLSAWLLPLMVAGFLLSGPLSRRAPRQVVRAILLGLSTFGAIAILLREALGS
jgi:uncharacterized membrane protein YfcA